MMRLKDHVIDFNMEYGLYGIYMASRPSVVLMLLQRLKCK